ncbi:helix-turn-helix domain-containing protein [Actinacidiphila sp. ITFR-21]|uniref:helix-turn-helix domain-containing protein n=1 Tax=Actinacidiphila sp. ITFR-21 TaxID=3075199 RepID=UPI00288BEE54|nr:helix-turn-helix domain-containing protein [Streptomyces sp. ITFR-21]WNI19927.1 helix-turn-helix domain-containing protein [Streptomyces sp. ITFR-21]
MNRPPGGLRLVAGEGELGRMVAGVWPVEIGAPVRPGGWTDVLALVGQSAAAAGGWADLVGQLVRSGAAGVVTAAPAADGLLSAALGRLPVLEARECSGAWLAQLVSDAREAEAGRVARAAAGEAERLRVLLGLVSGREDTVGVLRWLAGAVDGRAVLVVPDRRVPVVRGGLVLPEARIAAVAEGVSAAVAEVPAGEDWVVRLYGLGPRPPRDVLVVARRGGWPPGAVEPVAAAVRVLTGWAAQRRAAEADRAHLGAAVLEMLTAGQVEAARRAAGPLGLSPAVLAAREVRVRVLSTRTGRRDALVAELQHRLGERALVAPGSAGDRVVVLHPVPDPEGEEEGEGVGGVLCRVLDRDAGLCLGAGRPVPPEAVAAGRSEAERALSAAVDAPGRWATYTPVVDIASALPGAPAHRWARSVLAPLEEWPRERRVSFALTTRLALAYGPGEVARRLGVDRDTVGNRAWAVASAAGLDWSDPGDRIVLDVALRVRELRLRTLPYTGSLTFGDLLSTGPVAEWAVGLLGRLAGGDLLDVVLAWIGCGTDTVRTAARLGMDVKTVRARLHRAEELAQRTLITPSGRGAARDRPPAGVHDLVLAAYVTGRAPTVLTPRHLHH